MMSSRHTCGIVPGARGIHKGSVCHTLGLTPVTVLLNRPLSSVSGLYTHGSETNYGLALLLRMPVHRTRPPVLK